MGNSNDVIHNMYANNFKQDKRILINIQSFELYMMAGNKYYNLFFSYNAPLRPDMTRLEAVHPSWRALHSFLASDWFHLHN